MHLICLRHLLQLLVVARAVSIGERALCLFHMFLAYSYRTTVCPRLFVQMDVDDHEEFDAVDKALTSLDFSDAEKNDIWRLLAAIIHSGDVKCVSVVAALFGKQPLGRFLVLASLVD